MNAEEWRQIPRAIGRYEASSHGRVRSVFRGAPKVLSQCRDKRGRPSVTLGCGNRVGKRAFVHALIAEAFHGEKPIGLEVAHLNGINTDNRPENLMYVTRGENMRHRNTHGTGTAKFSPSEIEEVRAVITSSRHGLRELGRRYNVDKETIRSIKNGKTYRPSCAIPTPHLQGVSLTH